MTPSIACCIPPLPQLRQLLGHLCPRCEGRTQGALQGSAWWTWNGCWYCSHAPYRIPGTALMEYSWTPLRRPPTGPGKSGRLRWVPALEELVVVLSDHFLNRYNDSIWVPTLLTRVVASFGLPMAHLITLISISFS